MGQFGQAAFGSFVLPIPGILEAGLASADDVSLARSCSKFRKVLITKYKLQIVFPALGLRDDAEHEQAARLDGFGMLFHEVVPMRSSQAWD